jgi:hypothetical protein
MLVNLETERLRLRPWAESDVADYRTLVVERGNGTPPAEDCSGSHCEPARRDMKSGVALLPVRRRAENDFIGYCGLIVGRPTADESEIAYD